MKLSKMHKTLLTLATMAHFVHEDEIENYDSETSVDILEPIWQIIFRYFPVEGVSLERLKSPEVEGDTENIYLKPFGCTPEETTIWVEYLKNAFDQCSIEYTVNEWNVFKISRKNV